MSDQGQPTGPGVPDGRDPALADLRSRLDALQSSAESLGAEGAQTPPAQSTPSYGMPPDAAPPQQPLAPPLAGDYAPPSPPTQVWEGERTYGAYHEPLPAASVHPAYGTAIAVEPALAPNVARLEVGPFLDLIDLRHFEEAVARLDAVRDVHVRRYAHSRASVEVGLAGPFAIGRELQRLGRPLHMGTGAEGELIVDFTDVEGPAGEERQEPESTETAEGSA